MQYSKYLNDGIKALKKRDFLEAIHNLEKCIQIDKNNPLGYYYLGLSYIFRELYDDAYTFILKAYQLNDSDADTINALAFLNLKFGNIKEAINYWLDILDMDPNNYIAKINLNKLKNAKNPNRLILIAKPQDFINFHLKGEYFNYKLPLKFNIKPFLRKNYLLIIILLLISFGIIFVILSPQKIKRNYFLTKKIKFFSHRKKLNNITFPDINDDYIIDKNIKKSILKLKPYEIKKIFLKTKNLIKNKEYNKAIININKILHSNTSVVVKERFQILKTFIPEVESFTIKNNIPYSTLMNLPLLYQDVQVVWKGKIEDLIIDDKKNKTTFNLIVKEKNNSVGMAKIFFNKLLVNLTNTQNAIVSGKFLKLDNKTRTPVIKGIGIK